MKKLFKRAIPSCLAVLMIAGVIHFGAKQTYADGTYGKTIAAGFYSSMAVKEGGSLWAWGDNSFGQLGDSGYIEKLIPGEIMSGVKSVSTSISHTMVVKTDGTLWGWGRNDEGQLGDDSTAMRAIPRKVMDDVESVSTGFCYTMAVKTDGSLWGWGWNSLKHLGGKSSTNELTPVKIMDNVKSVSTGLFYTAVVKTDNTLWYWGSKYDGPIGKDMDFTAKTYSASIAPTKMMDDVVYVSVGANHIMAIKKDGTLWGWGNNDKGQLGDGSISSKDNPVKITDKVQTVSAGSFHTFAVKTDGTLWGWGSNDDGQLGDYTYTYRSNPIKLMDDVSDVSAGDRYTLALKSDGSLWGCGYNEFSQLGINSRETRNTFQEIMGGVKQPYAEPEPTPEPTPTPAPLPPEKTPSDWARDAIDALNAKRLIPLDLKQNYQNPITRAEFAALLANAYEYVIENEITVTATTFTDILNHQYEQELIKARNVGLIYGISETIMNPDGTLTREQSATMLGNFIQKSENISIAGYAPNSPLFADDGEISSWAWESTYYAVDRGIISGTGENKFTPKGDLTREMAMALVSRMIEE